MAPAHKRKSRQEATEGRPEKRAPFNRVDISAIKIKLNIIRFLCFIIKSPLKELFSSF